MDFIGIQNILKPHFLIRTSDGWYNASEFCRRNNTTFEQWQGSDKGGSLVRRILQETNLKLSDLLDRSWPDRFISPVLIQDFLHYFPYSEAYRNLRVEVIMAYEAIRSCLSDYKGQVL